MKKSLLVVFSVFICTQLAGCTGWAVRTSTSSQPRVDQEISGNRGFLFGKSTSSPKEPAFTERKVYKIELEIPQWPQKKELPRAKKAATPEKKDQTLWGNRGYIFGGPAGKIEKIEVEKSPVTKIKEEISQILEPKFEKTPTTRTYKVRKGDTLQKISRKFYGTTKKWLLLYKTNKDKLKGPDNVYPGQVLIIPEVSEFKK